MNNSLLLSKSGLGKMEDTLINNKVIYLKIILIFSHQEADLFKLTMSDMNKTMKKVKSNENEKNNSSIHHTNNSSQNNSLLKTEPNNLNNSTLFTEKENITTYLNNNGRVGVKMSLCYVRGKKNK